MYVILGATGHTGSAVAENLLAKGEKVRVIGRSKERLAKLSGQGAEAFVGDATDSTFLTQAFGGTGRVFHGAAEPDEQRLPGLSDANYRCGR
jgi:uncharacterized protein YbjT (DUF2867 family)